MQPVCNAHRFRTCAIGCTLHTDCTRQWWYTIYCIRRFNLRGACFQTLKAQLWLITVQRIYFRPEWNFDRKHPANNTRGTEKQHRSVMELTCTLNVSILLTLYVRVHSMCIYFCLESKIYLRMQICAHVQMCIFLGLFRTAISTISGNPIFVFYWQRLPRSLFW